MWTWLVTDATSSGPLVDEASAAVVTSAASTEDCELSNSSLPKKYSPNRQVGFSLTVTVASASAKPRTAATPGTVRDVYWFRLFAVYSETMADPVSV